MSSKKIFVFDTSTLLDNSKSLFDFGTSDIVIPLKVLEEIDNHKKRQDSVGANARDIIRTLDALRDKGSLAKGVRIQKGLGLVKIVTYDKEYDCCLGSLDSSVPDNEIIGTAAMVGRQNPDNKVILVTRDINLRVKCDSLNIECQDYKKDKIVKTSSEIYTGFESFIVSDDLVAESYKKDVEIPEELSSILFPNQFVRLISESDEKRSSVLIWNAKEKKLKTLDEYHGGVSKIKPRNKEQQAAFNILLDENIDFVTMTGTAGTGKSVLSLAAALELLEKNGSRYQKIIVSRPIMPMGKDIGFLPGPQPLDAKILTPSGWTTMGQIKVGDEVISRDGKPTKVLGVFPKGVKDVYKVGMTDKSSTEACLEHLWKVFPTVGNSTQMSRSVIMTTQQILEDMKTDSGKFKYSIERNEPVQFSEKDLKISPYVLGVILGDGYIGKRTVSFSNIDDELINRVEKEVEVLNCKLHNSGENIQFNIVCKDDLSKEKIKIPMLITNVITGESKKYVTADAPMKEYKINHYKTLFSRCKNNRTIDGYKYEFLKRDDFRNPIRKILGELGLNNRKAYDKFIPEIYKTGSIQQRLEVLKGLMDTDGGVDKQGSATFYTTSKQLMEDVEFIVRSLGGRARTTIRDRIGKKSSHITKSGCEIITRRISYCTTITLENEYNPFFISRKRERFSTKNFKKNRIESIELVGQKEVQCILVENPEHLYITDDFIVTHNTMEEKMSPWLGPIYDNLECILNTKDPVKKGKGKTLDYYFDTGIIEIEALTYIRGRSIPNAIIIIDEAQQLSAHEMKTILTRAGEGSKLIASGDLFQQDNPFVDELSNGLTYAIEKMKHLDYTAHISLRKGERSRLASSAADLL